MDSIALALILSNTQSKYSFLEAAKKAESVICCRTSPLQKAEIVKEMKKYIDGLSEEFKDHLDNRPKDLEF